MKRLSAIIIVLFLVCSSLIFFINFDENTNVAAEVSGNVSGTWGPQTYYVVGDITVPALSQLRILPGASVRFNGPYAFYVEGELISEGTVSSFVNFISNQTVPAEGDWKGIQFNASSTGSIVNSEIKHATTALNITGSSPNLALIEFTQCKHHVNVTTSKVIINSSGVDVNNVTIKDATGSLDVRFSVNVHTTNATADPETNIKDVTVEVWSTLGLLDVQQTDVNGEVGPVNCTAYIKTQAGTDYTMNNHTIQVNDSFFGTPYSYPGISFNSTSPGIDISSYQKVSNPGEPIYQIYLKFTFIYPPVIDDWPGKTNSDTITVNEDIPLIEAFKFHDNDHPNSKLTISVMSLTYGDLIFKGWVTYLPATNELRFLCKTEEWSNDVINITVKDPLGLIDFKIINVNFNTIPDDPIINLSAEHSFIFVYEDIARYVPIEILDDDDPFDELIIEISSPYVELLTNGSLKFLYPNEFGPDGKQENVYINVTDPQSGSASVKILVTFLQVNDPVDIDGPIPDQIKLETDVTWNLELQQYRLDPDPDETFSWWVTGLDTSYLSYSGDNGSAEILNFQIIGGDLGGADNPTTKTNTVTIWVKDNGNAMDNDTFDIKISSVNTPPSLSKNSVLPTWGNTAQTYNFSVKYRDLDGATGDVPDWVRVGIDGIEHDMMQSDPSLTDYSESVTFFYKTMLSAGEHEHYFICNDGADTGRLPHTAPENFTGPSVEGQMYIKTFWSADEQTVKARIAFYGEGGAATVTTGVTSPGPLPTISGDIGVFFNIVTSNMISIIWTEITVYYTNLDTTWVNNDTLAIYYWDISATAWEELGGESKNDQYVIYNTTAAEDILFISPALVLMVAGDLDADGDGYPNDSDKFPFDPAAQSDKDNDGHPDRWNKPDLNDETRSTIATTLDYDEFPNNASEWDDADGDGHGDNIDEYDSDAAAWRDTDKDGMPDEVDKQVPTDLKEDTDDDNDGMADWWEEKFVGLNPKDASDADEDLDGDGFTNKEEYDADTDPTDPDSFPEENGLIPEEYLMYLIFIIIIVVVIVIAAVIISRRKKPEEEEGEPEAPPEEKVEEPKAPAPQPPAAPAPAPTPTPPAPAPPPVPPPMEELPPPPEEEPETAPAEGEEEEAAETPEEEPPATEEGEPEEEGTAPAEEEDISAAEEEEMEELEETEDEEE